MNLSDLTFCEHPEELDLTNFDCGNQDLNDFLHNESRDYQSQLMASTFVFHDGSIIAFFSMSNDALTDKGEEKRTIWNKLSRKIANRKRKRVYPAVKIGRLGVSVEIQSGGLGAQILNFIIGIVLFQNKSACRFLIVDAYNNERAVKFYTKNGFQFLLESDQTDETRIMFLDLLPYKQAINSN